MLNWLLVAKLMKKNKKSAKNKQKLTACCQISRDSKQTKHQHHKPIG